MNRLAQCDHRIKIIAKIARLSVSYLALAVAIPNDLRKRNAVEQRRFRQKQPDHADHGAR